ncbi:MAG: cell division protein ZapD [Gammaproteobacteria bacterium]
MKNPLIIFEHPMHEFMRHLLKLEYLFQLFETRFNQDTAYDSKSALRTLVQIYQFIEASQIVTEILKDIERHIEILEKLHPTPTVNRNALVAITEELDDIKIKIEQSKPLTPWVKENYFLSQVEYRMSLPLSDLNFDMPQWHLWLHQSMSQRKVLLMEGLSQLIPVKQAVALILHLTRESTIPTLETADQGVFQKRLNSSLACQLIRVVLNAHLEVYPEITAIPNQIQIRFLAPDYTGEAPALAKGNIPFELTCCMI